MLDSWARFSYSFLPVLGSFSTPPLSAATLLTRVFTASDVCRERRWASSKYGFSDPNGSKHNAHCGSGLRHVGQHVSFGLARFSHDECEPPRRSRLAKDSDALQKIAPHEQLRRHGEC